MSSIPGSVPITFEANRGPIDSYLAELRRGVTVPLNFAPGGAGGNPNLAPQPFAPGVPRPGGANYSSPAANGGFADRQMSASARQAEQAWDRAYQAEARAAQAVERSANAALRQEAMSEVQTSGTGDGGGGRRGIFGLRRGTFSRYMTAGFAAHELAAVASSRSQLLDDENLAQSPMDMAKAQQRYANSLVNSSLTLRVWKEAEQFLPQKYQWLGNKLRGIDKAMQGAEEGERDVESRLHINTIERETNRIGSTTPGVDRQIQQIRDEYQDFKSRAATEKNVDERQRMQSQLPFLWQNSVAKIADLNHQRQLMREQEGRKGYALSAAAEGRFGVAREREFETGLHEEELAAARDGRLPEVQRNNAFKREARRQEIQMGIDLRDSESTALESELGHNPLAALRARVEGRRDAALKQARDNADRDSIKRQYKAELDLGTQEIEERQMDQRVGIRSHIESLDILVNGQGNPATREFASQINEVKRRTQLQELHAFQQGTPGLVPDIAKLGGLELGAMKENYLNSLRADDVDIQRTATAGAATEDPKEFFERLDAAVKELKDAPKKIADAIAALGALATD